ncbi:SpoIIE family protein phosphatase [Phormidium sp. LEGE 05292]|uniref:PP2C family protein-serine/threonine phosphatase n=1 Tax=[Phormidium] sp. LEGE 05292 TaxID=767427 RepID=UPI001881A515|nr:PP2C family protein-serine/threonine phosphatase [Phormidium sp. LEGE 05292]MBE9226176.1 SpoIIE family protein phosphatase [Phormidium sp. LEGE 05292]
MKRVFKPAIDLMNQLKYPQKFTLITMLLALPLSLMMCLFLLETNIRIDFTQKQTYGIKYLQPLRELREAIFESYLIEQELKYNFDSEIYQNKLKNANQRTGEIFQKLINKDRQWKNVLLTTTKLNEVKSTWEQLQENYQIWSPETKNVFYNRSIAQTYELTAKVGEASNLILDPYLDAYYFSDAILAKLPQIQRTLIEIKILGNSINRNQEITPEERGNLVQLSGSLKDYTQELSRNLEVALNQSNSPDLRLKLNQDLQELLLTSKQLNKQLDVLTSPYANAQPLNYIHQADQTLKLSSKLENKISQALNKILQTRIRYLRTRQQIIVIFVLLISGIVIYLWIAFYKAVMLTVEHLDEAAKRMTNGFVGEDIRLENKDELGQIGKSFNKIVTALRYSNEEVTRLNERLKTDNLRMSAELEIARQLQEMILPKEEELKQIAELDISGFMAPAHEVGGDYYDVLQQNGKIKIGIGDVTGHGLESGVVMIMAQTAVRTLLTVEETDPVKFLNALNQIIYRNTNRMKSPKNMTLSLLEYEAGVMRLSGQHEELIVVRNNGKIERIDTFDLGFPLGLEPDITPFIQQVEITLRSGEVAVLYTDGITEAVNSQNELYGLEKFYAILQKNHHLSADGIRQAVIDDLMSYINEQKVFDDITLVVIKQR